MADHKNRESFKKKGKGACVCGSKAFLWPQKWGAYTWYHMSAFLWKKEVHTFTAKINKQDPYGPQNLGAFNETLTFANI